MRNGFRHPSLLRSELGSERQIWLGNSLVAVFYDKLYDIVERSTFDLFIILIQYNVFIDKRHSSVVLYQVEIVVCPQHFGFGNVSSPFLGVGHIRFVHPCKENIRFADTSVSRSPEIPVVAPLFFASVHKGKVARAEIALVPLVELHPRILRHLAVGRIVGV